MKKSEIILTKHSPLMAVDTKLVGSDGKPTDTERVYSLCRCGESNFKPSCDGSHAQAEFVGEREDSDKPALEYYEGKEITIVYDRYLCMGAGYCGELEAVFGTHDAPQVRAGCSTCGRYYRNHQKMSLRCVDLHLKRKAWKRVVRGDAHRRRERRSAPLPGGNRIERRSVLGNIAARRGSLHPVPLRQVEKKAALRRFARRTRL